MKFPNKKYLIKICKTYYKIVSKISPFHSSSEKAIIKYRYIKVFQRLPEKKPARYNDFVLRIKIGDELYDPLKQFITDKEYVKIYISGTIGSQYNIETYQILKNEDDIHKLNLTTFPCIIKPTHRSGDTMIVKRQEEINKNTLYKWINKKSSSYYVCSKEKNYRYLKPKIIVEEFLSEDGINPPNDYKFFCFNGEVKFIQVDQNRHTRHTRNLYDRDWKIFNFGLHYKMGKFTPPPQKLDEMISIANKLSEPFNFVRIDMYFIGNEIRVGEITNLPESGLAKLSKNEAEYQLGKFFY